MDWLSEGIGNMPGPLEGADMTNKNMIGARQKLPEKRVNRAQNGLDWTQKGSNLALATALFAL